MPSFANLALATPRLNLRPLHAGDAEALFDIFSDHRVLAFWSHAPWTDLEPARQMIATDAELMAAGMHVRLAIETAQPRHVIGTCSLFNVHAQCRRAELGYALGAWAWGHGLMHEALRALLAFAFDDLALNRIEADVDPRNQRSARTLERLGFLREGLLRERWIVNGQVTDSHIYGLLRRDWDMRPGAGG
jgi:ribosomal-protein-alanine N-acetyltransferase